MTSHLYHYRAKVVRLVDGDTIDFDVWLGFGIVYRIRTRLLDVDTPERGQEGFHAATDVLRGLLDAATNEDGFVIIKTKKTGKYGRWLVDIPFVNKSMRRYWPND